MRRHRVVLSLVAASLASAAAAAPPAPRIFFTDLLSGPASGGESVGGFSGAYVTLYGNGFGTSQGGSTVTLGGANCLRVVSWGTPWLWYQKVVVQLGSGCGTGDLVATVNGHASNPSRFTVQSGHIYCVSTTGDDKNAGTFPSQCWSTVIQAKNTLAAGDIAYVEDGVAQTTVDNYSAAFAISSGGAPGAPLALVAYPGATVTIGTPSMTLGIRTPNVTGTFDHWVFAGLTVRADTALSFGWTDFRAVGNDLSCPGASGYSCIEPYGDSQSYLGNFIHDTGQSCPSNGNTCKLYHAVYFGVSNHDEFGWNVVDPDPQHTGVAGCRAVQFHTTDNSGLDDYDLHIHDNVIRDAICDGLNLVTVNPDLGTVEVYNNVIYHVGTGPAPAGVESDYACVYTSANGAPDASVQIYNNTMYDCGSRGNSSSGGLQVTIPTRVRNNVIEAVSAAEPYLVGGSASCSYVTGSNDLFFGNGPTPCADLSVSINVDPLFFDAGARDFHLQNGSLAANAGTTIAGLATDIDGVPRPQGTAFSVGAYEYDVGYVPPPPPDAGSPSGDAGSTSPDGGASMSDAGAGAPDAGAGSAGGGCHCGQTPGAAVALLALALALAGWRPARRPSVRR
jgi:hypothetical protein